MNHASFVIRHQSELIPLLNDGDLRSRAEQAHSILVQIYTVHSDPEWLGGLADTLRQVWPGAVVVGSTSVGEICDGQLETGNTMLSVAFFDAAELHPFVLPVATESEVSAGRHLAEQAGALPFLRGLLLLATPITLRADCLLQGLREVRSDLPVFGGGAADLHGFSRSWVMCNGRTFSCAAVAVALCGPDLEVGIWTHLGWQPVGRSMRLTDVEGFNVRTIDNRPAFEAYRHYLGIEADENFFLNSLEFPVLLDRNGAQLARIPIAVNDDLSLSFIADLQTGETVHFGYGSIPVILEQTGKTLEQVAAFAPEGLFLYSCSTRHSLMQEDVQLEISAFHAIAPASGFYTYGEFAGQQGDYQLLNATLVAVGLRERERPYGQTGHTRIEGPLKTFDAISRQHNHILQRLVYFTNVLINELVSSNRELEKLSSTDRLTGLANRLRLDEEVARQISLAQRHAQEFSLILLDLDHFKLVNDQHGHQVGDRVLIEIAALLRQTLRNSDTAGRWGGEEFLIVLPQTSVESARKVADKLRRTIAGHNFGSVGPQTASFGIAVWHAGDTAKTLFVRVDHAMYQSKHDGRNCVTVFGD
ncbi:diguanylate cyclase [Laribacter hongkongensis]|uniref:sensor domain-containing diguanylate cyclase n=1 Tax=Laribacter hongkongensis TaxID=168471 RepID=UPI001EFCA0D7|nr:diguanylate cyclase [Laribacter hongkongensis]MCG9057571.1 diguanylate cyclase [Laribacter hongkongensis]MCG9085975.1 diguanylate cyclase [Laribacter hongkongensis]